MNNFFTNFQLLFEKTIIGLNYFEISLFLLLILIAIFLRSIFAKFIVSKIKILILKTSNKVDDKVFNELHSPLEFLLIISSFMILTLNINFNDKLANLFQKINITLLTFFLFWFFHQAIGLVAHFSDKIEKLFSKALSVWLIKSIKYLIIFLGFIGILEIWGIKIGPIIAGLGLFGVAVALGAQDLFKNLISGILIILERRFHIGDVIEVPGQTTGTVEQIGFRSTLIRQFDTSTITIPNYIFSDSAIINFSQRRYRRIKWNIGLTYDISADQLKVICNDIKKYINESDDYIVNDEFQLFVRVERFNDSSIDILIYAFTNTNEWDEYLSIKEKLALKVKNIVESQSCSFAYPSSSIYIEKK